MKIKYVLFSTQESREKKIPSVLAIAETILMVTLTWGIAYYYNTYLHIYIAITIAPFLLLKTPESTKKAINIFLTKEFLNPGINKQMNFNISTRNFIFDINFLSILIVIAIFSFIFAYILSINLLIDINNWKHIIYISTIAIYQFRILLIILHVISIIPILIAIQVGITASALGAFLSNLHMLSTININGLSLTIIVIGSILSTLILAVAFSLELFGLKKILSTKINIYNFILLFLSLPIGYTIGFIYLIKSILIKVSITIYYFLANPLKAIQNIPKNYYEQTLINDIFNTPELLPDIHKKNNYFQLSGFLFNTRSKGKFQNLTSTAIAIIWSLGYIYRFSIKSTAWLFFPLAYLANLEALQNNYKKIKAIKIQTWDRLFWFNLFALAFLLVYFGYGNFVNTLDLADGVVDIINKIVTPVKDFLIPNAMCLLAVAVVLYFILNTIISFKEHIEDRQYNTIIYWLIRLITTLWLIAICWHIVVSTNKYIFPSLPNCIREYIPMSPQYPQ